jgi:deoxyribonuclease IV
MPAPNKKQRNAPRYFGPAGPLGYHASIAGGFAGVPEQARRLGARAIQVFTSSPRMWRARDIESAEGVAFQAARREHGILTVVAHAIYLINLASSDDALWRKSVDAFVDQVRRCHTLGIEALVVHPGSRGEKTVAQGRRRVLRALRETVRRTASTGVRILLETTAGGGGHLGGTIDDLAWLIAEHPTPERLGICLDTCHLFAAGFPLDTPRGLPDLLDQIAATVGLDKIGCIHVNDSLGELGTHRDRHARLGRGNLGKDFFRILMNEPRLFGVPKLLEVPGGDDAYRGDLGFLARRGPRK